MVAAWIGFGILLSAGILLTPNAIPAPAAAAPAPPPILSTVPVQYWGPSLTHLQHVITVVMENHDYDSYFGGYCQSLGPYCSMTGNGIPSGTCVPNVPSNLSAGCTVPFNLTAHQFVVPDMPHDWVSGPTDWDGGANDGFYAGEHGSTIPFGHYNGSTLPIYWDMAEQYAMSDNFFAANLSYSLPNHWDLLAGQAPNISYDSYVKNTTDRFTYRDQSNRTPTIQDLLLPTTVTWKYYDFGLIPIKYAYAGYPNGSAYDYWNPLAARAESYTTNFSSHIAPRADFLTDIANGTLPQLSWVIPALGSSDHPGFNVTNGESWVAQLVDAVENSSYWGSTAIFVIWDDYGGWYDHVAPPAPSTHVLSFRSPILVISPYAKENYISHTQLDFFSLLRFDEWQFGLGCLTPADCSAVPPFDFFDFNQTPRPPMLFPTNWVNASYPIPLEVTPNADPLMAGLHCAGCGGITPASWLDGGSTVLTPVMGYWDPN